MYEHNLAPTVCAYKGHIDDIQLKSTNIKCKTHSAYKNTAYLAYYANAHVLKLATPPVVAVHIDIYYLRML